jgi:hypothetical protein
MGCENKFQCVFLDKNKQINRNKFFFIKYKTNTLEILMNDMTCNIIISITTAFYEVL